MTGPDYLGALAVFVIGVIAGFGWGRAGIAETVARLMAELEVARQTGTLRERVAGAPGLRERVVKSLLPGGAVAPLPPAAAETAAREASINRGAEMILADAKARRISVTPEDARRMAAEMIADAGLT